MASTITTLQHHSVVHSTPITQWLEPESSEADMYFLQASTPPDSPSSGPETASYFTLPQHRLNAIQVASAELHAMFSAATERVLSDNALLAKFRIPESLHTRVKSSFTNHKAGLAPQPIAGRLDLAITDDEIKVYEYNADSASCLYECGSSQGRWSAAVGLEQVGQDAGAGLFADLVVAWTQAGIPSNTQLHILIDDNEEEKYHGRYMQSAAAAAGIRTKLVTGLDGLHYATDGSGDVLDQDQDMVTHVWKSWSWETVFDDYLASQQSESFTTQDVAPISLSGVLLSDRITVWEPLWSCIANNKAILPVLWEMYPHHPYLLQAEFTLTEGLKNAAAGYVAKPIVGRCGSNVTMMGSGGIEVLESLGGQFDAKDLVYQEIRHLPRIQDRSVLVCPWVISGRCGGVVLRVDSGLITTVDSPIECLRIIPNETQKSVPAEQRIEVVENVSIPVNDCGCGCEACDCQHCNCKQKCVRHLAEKIALKFPKASSDQSCLALKCGSILKRTLRERPSLVWV